MVAALLHPVKRRAFPPAFASHASVVDTNLVSSASVLNDSSVHDQFLRASNIFGINRAAVLHLPLPYIISVPTSRFGTKFTVVFQIMVFPLELSGLAAYLVQHLEFRQLTEDSQEALMPDPLYLSLWFPHFETIEMLPRAVSVMRQFLFSKHRPGITYVALHPVSWSEATVLEERFDPGISPEEAAAIAQDLLHADYAYTFDAYWDLWIPVEGQEAWAQKPSPVKFMVHGPEFEHPEAEVGDIQVDLGFDTPFLYEQLELTPANEDLLRENVAKLVAFSAAIEKNTAASARLLWSESEANLAQKLIARLQKVQ